MTNAKNILLIVLPALILILIAYIETTLNKVSAETYTITPRIINAVIIGAAGYIYIKITYTLCTEIKKSTMICAVVGLAVTVFMLVFAFTEYSPYEMFASLGTMFLLSTVFILGNIHCIVKYARSK